MSAELPAPVVGWIVNHAKKHFWRVQEWYEIDDLIQDGLVCGYKCLNRYGRPGFEIDPPHFMRLVQSTFLNHIGELLRRKRGVDDITVKYEDFATEYLSHREGKSGRNGFIDKHILDAVMDPADGEQDLAALLLDLPEKLRKVIELYINWPEEIRRPFRVKLDGEDESLSDRLFRLCGFPKNLDFETELRSLIWERNSI